MNTNTTTTTTTSNTTKSNTRGRRATALVAACLALATTAAACSTDGTSDPASAMPRTRLGDATSQRRLESTGDADSAVPVLHRTDEYGNATDQWSSMYEYLEFVVKNADRYWTALLVGAGLPEPQVNYVFPAPGETYQSSCTDNGTAVSTDDNSMFYCPADDTIYFSQSIAVRLWEGSYVGPDRQQNVSGGDFVVAYLVAHEFAHSIQAELGLTTAGYSVPQREKHADCWSGVWAQQAEREGILDENDLTEGWNGAWVVGDSFSDSPDHHGTGEERQQAFWTGYTSTSPADCDIYLT